MSQTAPIQIPTDPETTVELRRAMAQAKARGVSLGKYLKSVIPAEPAPLPRNGMSVEEWTRRILAWTDAAPEGGNKVDDSREAIYSDDE